MHQHLVATKKQTSLSLILESGEPREVHHFATLLGYGACAVNPYLALDTIHELIEEEMLDKDYYAAVEDYTLAILPMITYIARSTTMVQTAIGTMEMIRDRRMQNKFIQSSPSSAKL